MKYLKNFESASYSSEFIENIKDLFLDMSDEYYKIWFLNEKGEKDMIKITKGEHMSDPIWTNLKERDEFLEKIENILDYIKSEGFDFQTSYSSGWIGSPGIMSYKILLKK